MTSTPTALACTNDNNTSTKQELSIVGTRWKWTQNIHNLLVNVADALHFRPIAEDTKAKYYDIFKQGHSPSSAHIEYEANLLLLDDQHLLVDTNKNPKISDVYNQWRKMNLGDCTGKQLYRS